MGDSTWGSKAAERERERERRNQVNTVYERFCSKYTSKASLDISLLADKNFFYSSIEKSSPLECWSTCDSASQCLHEIHISPTCS